MSGNTTPIGAIVLAAGRSTRFRSARSKLAHELGGRPMVRWLLDALERARVAPVVVVVAPDGAEVRAACAAPVSGGAAAVFAVQREPRGTGDAALAAATALRGFSGSVLVLNGDLPLLRPESIRRVVETHREAGAGLTVLTAKVVDPYGWGRILRRDGRVIGIVEERDASAAERALGEVNVGVYCARVPLLFELLRGLSPDNAQGEIYLTDIVGRAARAGETIADAAVDAAEVQQINSRGELAAVEKIVRRRVNAEWMAAGVTMEDPETTYVGPDATIGADTFVGPNVHLRGRTSIGSGCRLDGSAFITDSIVADGVHLRFGVVLTGAEVGARCQIGPFAHLRPRTRLGEDVHIGDFVETKNAVLGRGVKANHLAYLGDAEVGQGSNIGAGTITCNYDGFDKYRTVIGERVQVGSDSTLVAPVVLGDDAYVATATTVRRDVSSGALVFNPRGQEERAGWVEDFRKKKASGKRQKAKGKD